MPVNSRRYRERRAVHALATVAALIAPFTFGSEAYAQVIETQYRRAPAVVELPPPEARGCYYYRGRRYCGAYCYWEVNGKRYCQRRERDAHSQAPLAEFDYAPVLK